MKKLLALILALWAMHMLPACGGHIDTEDPPTDSGTGSGITQAPDDSHPTAQPAPTVSDQPTTSTEDKEEITVMYLYINGNKVEVTLAENVAVEALVEILKQGDIAYIANDYGGFEKVGSLGHALPTDNSQITTQSGDVILYSGNQIVLFYGSNSWSYTRLGRIEGYSTAELRDILCVGEGSVQIRISLE